MIISTISTSAWNSTTSSEYFRAPWGWLEARIIRGNRVLIIPHRVPVVFCIPQVYTPPTFIEKTIVTEGNETKSTLLYRCSVFSVQPIATKKRTVINGKERNYSSREQQAVMVVVRGVE